MPYHSVQHTIPPHMKILNLQIHLLAKFICNPKINTGRAFRVICRHTQSGKKLESFDSTRSRLRYKGTMLCLLVSALTLWSIQCHVFQSCDFSWLFHCLNDPHKRSIEVLSSVPRHKKAVMRLTEKSYMLDNLHSGMSYRAVGHEFNVNEVSLNRSAHKTKLCVDQWMKML